MAVAVTTVWMFAEVTIRQQNNGTGVTTLVSLSLTLCRVSLDAVYKQFEVYMYAYVWINVANVILFSNKSSSLSIFQF